MSVILASLPLALLLGLFNREVWGWLPYLSRAAIWLGTSLLPRPRRLVRREEWHGELLARFDDRRVAGLFWVLRLVGVCVWERATTPREPKRARSQSLQRRILGSALTGRPSWGRPRISMLVIGAAVVCFALTVVVAAILLGGLLYGIRSLVRLRLGYARRGTSPRALRWLMVADGALVLGWVWAGVAFKLSSSHALQIGLTFTLLYAVILSAGTKKAQLVERRRA